MMTIPAPQRGRELFESGYCCAESVLLALAEHQGIESDLLPGIARGLCGGMARTCRECGAVTGAILGLGLAQGPRVLGSLVDPLYESVQAVLAGFEAQFGTTNCQQLTGVDLGTPEGQQAFGDQGKMADCLNYVEQATRLALAQIEKTTE